MTSDTIDKLRQKVMSPRVQFPFIADRRFLLLDLAFVVVFVLFVFGEHKVILFHIIFVLLTFGAFFWTFPFFVVRTGFWVTATSAVLLVNIFNDEIPFEEITEIPLLSLILVLVFVIARQRTKANRALTERTGELSMLLAISNNVAVSHDLESALDLILDHLTSVIDYDGATIFSLNGENLSPLAHKGAITEEGMWLTHVSLSKSLVGQWLLVDKKPLIIPDVWTDTPRAQALRAAIDDHFVPGRGQDCALIGLPLTITNRITGVLTLQHNRKGIPYWPSQADLILGIANQAALVLENARYHEQTQELAAVRERQRLARDLHDAVSQTLFSASLSAEVLPRLWERNPGEARRCLGEIHHLNRSALAEMRTLLLELRPEALTETELDGLLSQLTQSIGNHIRLPIALTVEKVEILPPDVQIAFYRITQEALNNVVKHAAASQAAVHLRSFSTENGRKQRKGLVLRIVDDGQGFDPNRISSASLGLGIMRERAETIGAEFRIESEIGHGTKVVVVWTGIS